MYHSTLGLSVTNKKKKYTMVILDLIPEIAFTTLTSQQRKRRYATEPGVNNLFFAPRFGDRVLGQQPAFGGFNHGKSWCVIMVNHGV